MHDSGQETVAPAVLVGNGAEAVGIAQADTDGLGIDGEGEGASHQRGDKAAHRGGYHIAQHDRPDIAGVGAGVAGGEHTEDDAEGNAVEGSTNQVVVAQNEQTEHTHVHQEHGISVG